MPIAMMISVCARRSGHSNEVVVDDWMGDSSSRRRCTNSFVQKYRAGISDLYDVAGSRHLRCGRRSLRRCRCVCGGLVRSSLVRGRLVWQRLCVVGRCIVSCSQWDLHGELLLLRVCDVHAGRRC